MEAFAITWNVDLCTGDSQSLNERCDYHKPRRAFRYQPTQRFYLERVESLLGLLNQQHGRLIRNCYRLRRTAYNGLFWSISANKLVDLCITIPCPFSSKCWTLFRPCKWLVSLSWLLVWGFLHNQFAADPMQIFFLVRWRACNEVWRELYYVLCKN